MSNPVIGYFDEGSDELAVIKGLCAILGQIVEDSNKDYLKFGFTFNNTKMKITVEIDEEE